MVGRTFINLTGRIPITQHFAIGCIHRNCFNASHNCSTFHVSCIERFVLVFLNDFYFRGRAAIATPIIYYQFLVRRYTSRRNPYTRNMFHELRILFESTAAKPGMPGFVKQILLGIVSITSKLAPPPIPSPQQAQ